MAFCKNCGAALEEGASFCTFCGSKIELIGAHNTGNIADTPLPETVLPGEMPQVSGTVQKNPEPYKYTNNVNTQPGIQKTTNSWMGILAFILAFFGFTSPVAIILGILDIVLKKGRRHALAIWGIILGVVFSIALIATLSR